MGAAHRSSVLAVAAAVSVAAAMGLAVPAVASVVTETTIPTAGSSPVGIAAGSDGALWFTEQSTNKIGRITTGGAITEITIPTANSGPIGIAAGSDGALWFIENSTNQIGRITVDVGPPGPAGSPGPAGLVGPPGPVGPAGPATTRTLLVTAFGEDSYRARRARSLRLRYVSTMAASVTVELRKGRRTLARTRTHAKAGRNNLTLRGLRATGRFTLRLTATIPSQTSTDTAGLTVTR